MKIAVAGATGRAGRHVVDVLRDRGHEVVPMARSTGVDVITGEGLAEALAGVECIVDLSTGPTPDEEAATEFFTTAARNLQERGREAGVQRMVVVSIVGIDRFTNGYNAAKVAQERAVRRARSRRGSCARRSSTSSSASSSTGAARAMWPTCRRCARSPSPPGPSPWRSPTWRSTPTAVPGPVLEVAGPREESLVDIAERLVAKQGDPVRVEGVTWDPLYEEGAALPGPEATLAGPTFDEWLAA